MRRILSLVLSVVIMSICFMQSSFANDKPMPRSIPVTEENDIDGNDDLDSAQVIENDFTVTGNISSTDDESDYYKIVPTITGKMNVWLGNIPNTMDLDLYMYYENGNMMSEPYWSRGTGTTELITDIPVVKGQTYYIEVYLADIDEYSSQEYQLRARVIPNSYTFYSQTSMNYDTTNLRNTYFSDYTSSYSWYTALKSDGCVLNSYAMILNNLGAKTTAQKTDIRTSEAAHYLTPDPFTVLYANTKYAPITLSGSKYISSAKSNDFWAKHQWIANYFGKTAMEVSLSGTSDPRKAEIIAYYLAKHPEGIAVFYGNRNDNHTIVFTSTTYEVPSTFIPPTETAISFGVEDEYEMMSSSVGSENTTTSVSDSTSTFGPYFTVCDPSDTIGQITFDSSWTATHKGGWSNAYRLVFFED